MNLSTQTFSSLLNENDVLETLETLSMENVKLVYQRVDQDGNSLLFCAVQNGFNTVAQNILQSSSNYSLSGKHGSTPLHFAPNSSESVLRLLLMKHRDLMYKCDENGFNVLHQWAEIKKTWQFNILEEADFEGDRSTIFTELIKWQTKTEFEDYPLHIAASKGNLEFVKVVVEGYNEIAGETPPWRAQNNYEQTPLHMAIYKEHNEIALYLLQKDPTLSRIPDNGGQSPFLLTVLRGRRCEQLVREIMRIEEPRFSDLRCNDGTTLLHWLYGCAGKTNYL